MAKSPIRVAVIGCGPIGNRHADLHQANPQAELVAVCDFRRDRCQAAAKRLDVPGFYDVPSMLAAIKPDVCSVATGGVEYGSDHYLPTIQALQAGCHVLCEKPVANTVPLAQKMVDCAKKHQRCFGVDFNHRFTDAATVVENWLAEDRIGQQLFLNMSMWIKNPNESSPFYMFKALNPHTIDVMRHFGGDIKAVQCFATKARGRNIWTTLSMNCQFASGAVGHLSASYDIDRGHPMERCEIAGLKGRIVLEDMWREATLYPAGNPVKQVYTNPVFGGHRDFTDTFRNRLAAFIRQIADGAQPEEINGSGEDALAVLKVQQAMIDSFKTKSIIYLED